MDTYTKEELEKIHEKLMEISTMFRDFCKENDLLCYFCGGGCIGAVRHGGFIPWDDDLDFFMPRNDYEKLKTLWKNDGRYVMDFPTRNYQNGNSFITIRDSQTTFIKSYQKQMDLVHGLALDIFPLDGCPSDRKARKRQKIDAMVYSLFSTGVIPSKHGGVMKLGGSILLGLFRSPQMRWRIWSRAEKRMRRYPIAECEKITELCAGVGYMQKEYPKECFASAVEVPFEDTVMPIPVGYDGYLKLAFGDYMTPPPPEKRVTVHDFVRMDMEHPYTDYKGRDYCTGKD